MKSLAKNSIYNALYQVLNMLFPLISSVYVARTLMPDGVGRVAYAQNIASYFATAAALGIPTVGLRVISVAREERKELDKAFSELTILNAISTTVSLAFYVVLIFLNPAFRSDYRLFLITGLTVAFNYINIEWLYKGNEEYVYIVVRSLIIKIASLVALFIFVRSKDDYIIYALITSLALCGNYVFNAWRAHRYASFTLSELNIKRHIKPVMLLAGAIFFSTIYSKLDTTMLGIMVGDVSVGYYSYAHKVLQIGISFCNAVTFAFLPRLSYYFQKDKDQFHALISKGVQIIAFLAVPSSVGLFILAPDAVLVLFGSEFLPAAQTLRIFSILILVFALGNLLCYQMMICSGSEKKHVLVLGCAAAINVIFNCLLIPKYKHNGAAYASVITELFINLVEGVYFCRKLHIKLDYSVFGQAILSAAVMVICILVVKQTFGATTIAFVFSVISGVCTYAIMNVLLKNRLTLDALAIIRKKVRCRGN